MNNKLTLRKLKNTEFVELYRRFMQKYTLSENEISLILSIAVVLINFEDPLLQRLGYRIIVEYCNQSENYFPLYELAINYGLYPISKYIEEHFIQEKDRNVYTCWNDAYAEQYKQGNRILTNQQLGLNQFFSSNHNKTITIVAPTSYGKSELIIQAVDEYKDKHICIITSTKALLMQTKKRIRDSGVLEKRKIIIHPEMYNQESSCVAVLTQERLMRLLKKDQEIRFDCVVVDEAHELLEDNLRSNVLACTIIILQKRNPDTAFKFLTPFISETNNLQPRYIELSLSSYKVTEYLKTEKYYMHDIRNGEGSFYYDQFMDEYWEEEKATAKKYEEEIVKSYSARKNIVYLNKPVDIEQFALALADILPDVDSPEINNAIKNIAEYLQPQYNLLTCMKKGVIYHHGSVPDAIRIYIEDLYKRAPEIRFVITTSTLLSGVNLPAERMFILDNKKGKNSLRPEAFKNLIGRICRFSEIFHPDIGSLKMLEPQIHIVFGKYFSKNANYKSFIKEVAKADIQIEDQVENILLINTRITENNRKNLKEASEFIENYENGIIENYSERYIKTNIGKSCIMNGIREINIFENELKMQETIDNYISTRKRIDNTNDLLDMIQHCFLDYLSEEYDSILRLKHNEACRFYSMMLDWQTENKSYAEMISLFIQYWRELFIHNRNAYVYVGRWGNEGLPGTHKKPYVYLKKLDRTKAINLAIVRIKEEKDFIDNSLMKFIDALYDVNLLDEIFYTKVKYGTDNPDAICLLKNGLSLSLSLLLLEKYKKYINIDTTESIVQFSSELINAMKLANENQILIYEVNNNM